MRILNLLFMILALTFSVSCSKKSNSQSRVVVQFDKSIFENQAQSSLGKTSALNHSGPNWGLSDPSSLADIDCFGVFVGGPEEKMHDSSCDNGAGDIVAQFGPRAGFFPIDGPGELMVPAGLQRKFILVGMASVNGSCEAGFDVNPNINFPNYSAPFILGQTVADLAGSEAVVSIALNDSFSSSNRINNCSFITPDADDGSGPALSVTYFESKRNIWVDDNDLPRTVNFTHAGASVSCSRDGGTTFSTCDSDSSLLWLEADRASNHHIRVLHDDGTVEEEIFKPDDDFANVQFVSCDDNFSGTTDLDSISAPLASALATANRVICFADGTVLEQGAGNQGPIAIASNGITLIARQGELATIKNNLANKDVLKIWGQSGIRIVGLDFDASASATYSAIVIGNSTTDLELQDVNIVSSGNGVDISTTSGSAGGNSIRIFNSSIDISSSGFGIQLNTTSYAQVFHSHIKSYSSTLVVKNSSELHVVDSKVENLGAAAADLILSTFEQSTVSITGSEIFDHSGGGINLDGGSAGTSTLEFSDNYVVRKDSGLVGGNPFFNGAPLSASNNEIINSANNGNFFCNINSLTNSFSAMLGANLDGGTFAEANQDNPGAVITDCP